MLRELVDRDTVDARFSLVARHLTRGHEQVRLVGDLVDQAKPFLSFDALFERCQHAIRPNGRFGPRPSGAHVSGLFSRLGHCRRGFLRSRGHFTSIFLCPLAPPALPGFLTTTDTLTPGQPALRRPSTSRLWSHEHRPVCRPGLPASRIEPSVRSVSNHPSSSHGLGLFSCHGRTARNDLLDRSHPGCRDNSVTWASPQPSRLATTIGRIEFVKSYGPVVHLQLLPTPSREDAVTFSYRVQTKLQRGLPPRRFNARTGALGYASA
jgi:hypothetical protein